MSKQDKQSIVDRPSTIYGVKKRLYGKGEYFVSFFYDEEKANNDCKERGSSNGDYAHFAYHHTVEELTIE